MVDFALDSPGKRLVGDLSRPSDPVSVQLLIIEAGRVADRLEKLDRLLSGDIDSWVTVLDRRDKETEIVVDGAMVEARQQAGTLRTLLAEVRRIRAAEPEAPADDDVLADM